MFQDHLKTRQLLGQFQPELEPKPSLQTSQTNAEMTILQVDLALAYHEHRIYILTHFLITPPQSRHGLDHPCSIISTIISSVRLVGMFCPHNLLESAIHGVRGLLKQPS